MSVCNPTVMHGSKAGYECVGDGVQLTKCHGSFVILPILDPVLKNSPYKILKSLESRSLQTAGGALSCVGKANYYGF